MPRGVERKRRGDKTNTISRSIDPSTTSTSRSSSRSGCSCDAGREPSSTGMESVTRIEPLAEVKVVSSTALAPR